MKMNPGIRIQITLYDILQAEVIVDDYITACKLWDKFTVTKYHRGKDFGGCMMARADLPRYFNVPVGSSVK